DEPPLLVDGAAGRRLAGGDLHRGAVVGQARVVAFGELPGPETLAAAPGLKMPGQGLVEPVAVGLADVDRLAALADDIDAGLALERAQPGRVRHAAAAD